MQGKTSVHRHTIRSDENGTDMTLRDEKESASVELGQKLMEEINILKLEGALFCFDPRAAKKRRGAVTLAEARKHPVTLRIHPDYGQPSVLAYKVLQAIFWKLTEYGCDMKEDGRCVFNDTVTFSARELASLTGRVWSGKTSEELYHAISQLHLTSITASLFDKEKDEWLLKSFVVLTSALFAGKGEKINRCSVRIAPEVMDGINKKHYVFFNLQRLNQLDTIGLVLYKRIFFHLSNLMQGDRKSHSLKFTKDYKAICKEWLGELKPHQYKAHIIKDQLGRHLEAIIATGLIRRYTLEKNVDGTSFNFTCYPGKGFFEDYQSYYIDRKPQQRPTFHAVAELEEVKALELVAYFHRLFEHRHTRFEDHEVAYATELLTTYGAEEGRDLVGYAIDKARKTKYEMLYLGGVKKYVAAWEKDRSRTRARERQAETRRNCPLCNEAGFLELKQDGTHRLLVHPCPHTPEAVTKIENGLKAHRI